MKEKLVCIVLFGAIFFAWWWAGGVCEVASKGPQRFEALIALFTAFAFAGVVISLITQRIQFKDIMSLQLKAAEAAERAAIANHNSAEIAEKNLHSQQKIAEQENNLAFTQLKIQYITLRIQGLHRSAELAIITKDSQGMQDVLPEIKRLLNEIETLLLGMKRCE